MSVHLKANRKGEVKLFLLASDTESGTEVHAFAGEADRRAHWQSMLDSEAAGGPEEGEDWLDFVEDHRKDSSDTFQDEDVTVAVVQLVQIREAFDRFPDTSSCLDRIKEIMQWHPKPKKSSRSR